MSGPAPVPTLPAPARAFAVFCGQTDLAWLRLLRPGFRHCFLAINDGRHWLTLDPLATFMEIAVQPVPPAFDLPGWYRARGFIVVPAAIDRGRRRPAPWAPFTCVEAVKRALGIHARRVITPYQLFRHLTRPAAGLPAAAASLASATPKGRVAMSGLFSSPKAPPPPPAAPPAPVVPAPEVAAAVPGDAAGSAADLAADPAALRIAFLRQRERGRAGTVATSWRGILAPGSDLPRRKQLLGE